MTPCAPAASAVRSTVPALPGSRTLASTATRRGRAAASCARGMSRKWQTASSPWGVTVWASSAMTSPLTVCTGTPQPAASSTRSRCRSRAGPVTNSSVSVPGRRRPSRTACGPSARNERDRSRNARLASCRAALARGDRILVISPVAGASGGRSGSGGAQVSREGLASHLDQGGEGRGVGDGQLSEHPPVDLDTGDLEALDEPVVGHALGAGRGIDPLDPQPPERALAVLAVAVGVGHGVERLLLGLAVQPGPLAPVTARPLQDDPALLVGVDCPLHACHLVRLPGSKRCCGGPGHFPSSRFIFLVSAGASGTSPAKRRVRALVLCSSRWLRLARRRMTLPVPVSRNRLLAPLCVFIFGMSPRLRSCVPPHGARLVRVPAARFVRQRACGHAALTWPVGRVAGPCRVPRIMLLASLLVSPPGRRAWRCRRRPRPAGRARGSPDAAAGRPAA